MDILWELGGANTQVSLCVHKTWPSSSKSALKLVYTMFLDYRSPRIMMRVFIPSVMCKSM